ncbi:MAG: enoyl-CoA hydratase/isomerase family protein [Pseudomonadales bacterium]|nr:enoyl-CoA hydratase/isomerase family protein [Pseudomonadales bacterium]
MTEPIVKYEQIDHVAVITTNRPEQYNAQSRKLLEELDRLFAEAGSNPDVRVITLFGAGKHFSAGHDLGSAAELQDREERPHQQGVRGHFDHSREQFVEKSMRWRNVPKPTIAGVHGYCIFGGWILASAMDIIYAGQSAMFLASNFQFFTVPWDLHPRKAKELLYESRFIDAREALDLELVNCVVPDEELQDTVLEYATRIAQNDPFQLRMMKMAVNQMQDTQGYHAHISSAHLMHMLSATGEKDPDYALKVPDKKRRPMVERAFENYHSKKDE